MKMYEKAKTKMEAYSDFLVKQYMSEAMVRNKAIDMFNSYVKCMIDNELCGEGFGIQAMESFNCKIVR